MAYETILDNEVDPGSPITHSLIRRLRDNPYLVLQDVAVDGSLGTKSRSSVGSSGNPLLNTVWDNPVYGAVSPGGSDPLVVTGSPLSAIPRNAPLACGLPVVSGIFLLAGVPPFIMQSVIYYDGAHTDTYTSKFFVSLVYSGGVPVAIRVKCTTATPTHTTNGAPPTSVITLPLATSDTVDIDLGVGFVGMLQHVSGAYTNIIYVSASVDLEVASLTFRVSRTDATYGRPTIGQANGAYTFNSLSKPVYSSGIVLTKG